VNEACNLIRKATQNEDVQINFGVVIDEKMEDHVKITVIATGFQREGLPEIDRRNPHFPFTPTNAPDLPAVEPEPEPVIAASPEPSDEAPVDDYEMPAILRKQRRMVQ
jgi:cell division protein FtsZ